MAKPEAQSCCCRTEVSRDQPLAAHHSSFPRKREPFCSSAGSPIKAGMTKQGDRWLFIAAQARPAHPSLIVSFPMEPAVKLKNVQWIGLVGLVFASSGAAQPVPGGWGGPGYGTQPGYLEPPGTRDPREGKIQVQTFAASTPAFAALGHGPITINSGPGGPDLGLFQAAIADQLTHSGYQVGAPGAGQALDLTVIRQVIQPPEPRHSPISGGVDVGIGGGVG